MKEFALTSFIFLFLSSIQLTHAQGTTYLSNLEHPSSGSIAVGGDQWLAASFFTTTNPAVGYDLNSIQLAMNDATGTPNGFTVMLYSVAGGSTFPGTSLGTLSGSSNPSTAGIFTYTVPSNLSRIISYFIVITAATPVASGAYEWSFSDMSSYNAADGWGIPSSTPFLVRGSGGRWNPVSGTYFQFAINATPVPEPGLVALFVLGGLSLLWLRRKGA